MKAIIQTQTNVLYYLFKKKHTNKGAEQLLFNLNDP